MRIRWMEHRTSTLRRLAASLVLTVVGCGGSDSPTAPPAEDNGNPEPPAESCALLAPPQAPTILGVHGTTDPNVVAQLGAPLARFILADRTIREALTGTGAGAGAFTKIRAMHDAGRKVIATVRFPEDPDAPAGSSPDRIPMGADRAASLQLVRDFLTTAGSAIDWVQLNNEPVGGPGSYVDGNIAVSAGSVPALDWLRELATVACETRAANAPLADLRIMSPGLTGLREIVVGDDLPANRQSFLDSLIVFAEANTEALDLHLHVASVAESEAIIDLVRARTAMPLTSTEWSEAKVSEDWLKLETVDPAHLGITNRQWVLLAYDQPVTAEVWQQFTSAAPSNPNFLAEHFQMLRSRGFLHGVYASVFQFGQPIFDLKALFANRTVVGAFAPNDPVHAAFAALVDQFGS
jgi:hypothetical protein